jgi:hypothetical protein
MAISSAMVWEIRATGSDSNGGGFKAGATGTDRSQQDAAQVAIDNSTITTSITANVITFTGYVPTSADPGNVVQMLTGTNVTAGFYEIIAQTPTTWTVAGAVNLPTSGTTTNATGNMGGAMASAGGLKNAPVASNSLSIKAGSYGIGNGTVNTSGNAPAFTANPLYIEGYQTTRGDLGTRPIFTITTPGGWPANQDMILFSGGRISNIEVRCASASNSRGINASNNTAHFYRCLVKDTASRGLYGTSDCIFEECIADNATFFNNGNGGTWKCCVAINGGTFGGSPNKASSFVRCIAYKSGTAASATAFTGSSGGAFVFENCVAYNYTTGFSLDAGVIENCVAEKCTTGFTASAATVKTILRNCAGFNNTTNVNANISNNNGFIACTASPFVDAANGNFALNNTGSAGAALRGTGTPGAFQSISTTSYPDIGAAQHQETAAVGSSNFGIRSGGRL